MAETTNKSTIYIEADDEITTVIEKVVTAKSSIVAIVLPKRANVFQSVVNMKLLKKAAEESKKKIVLISSDGAVEPIAAIAGVHVATSLTTKPAIPKRAKANSSPETISSKEFDGGTPKKADEIAEKDNEAAEDDTIELDNTTNDAKEVPLGTIASMAKDSKKRSFKIPDFGSFRLKMMLGALLAVLLIVGWVFGFIILPKANIIINTDTSNAAINFDFIASTSAQALDVDAGIIPATKVETTKEDKATVPASGKKDVGEKASGSLTLVNCRSGASGVSVPAGSTFSASGKNFVTTEAVELGPAVIIGTCRSAEFPAFGAVKSVNVIASASGESYNLAAQTYQSPVTGVTATGTAMTGGTTQLVTIVSSEDINKAKEQLKGAATAEALSELKTKLEESQLQALNETMEASEPVIKSSATADSEATEVTVTQTVSYMMLGIKTNDLSAILDERIKTTLNDESKTVRDNGLADAVYLLATKTSVDDQTLSLQTVATIGPIFDETALKNEIISKKRGEIEKMLESRDGVKSVSVEYSPFWITTTPKSVKKINIQVNEIEN